GVSQGVDSVCSELFLAGKVNVAEVGVEVGGRDGFGRVPFGDVDLVPRIPGLSPAEEFQDSVNDHRSKPPHKCAADGEGWSTEALVSGSVGCYRRDAEFWIDQIAHRDTEDPGSFLGGDHFVGVLPPPNHGGDSKIGNRQW